MLSEQVALTAHAFCPDFQIDFSEAFADLRKGKLNFQAVIKSAALAADLIAAWKSSFSACKPSGEAALAGGLIMATSKI